MVLITDRESRKIWQNGGLKEAGKAFNAAIATHGADVLCVRVCDWAEMNLCMNWRMLRDSWEGINMNEKVKRGRDEPT